jgi:CBS domain-containing protein
MPPALLKADSHERFSLPDALGSELLDREVGDVMTPGCVAISEDASVAQAAAALSAHRVHAVLIVGAVNGTPLGWVTARGLLGWLDRDRSVVSAREAVLSEDGNTISGAWEKSDDGSTWEHDFDLTYTRVAS